MPQRFSLALSVYRNGVLNTGLEVISMQESAGVEKLDVARLLYKNLNFEGRSFHSQIVCDEIEIKRTVSGEVLHWGKVAIIPAQINPQGEDLIIVSRAEKFHLGDRVNGTWVWNPLQASTGGGDAIGGPELIADEMIFNPLIDGKIQGNLNNTFTSEFETTVGTGHPLFLNPESVRTEAAMQLQITGYSFIPFILARNWPLSKCIFYLLATLNSNETNVTNPTLTTIEVACNDSDDVVQNVHIPRGVYMAEALDLLLEPLGYRWRIKRTAIGARTFEFYRQDSGTIVAVRHQAIGQTLDLGLQNTEALAMTFDVANLFNDITIVGGHYGYEVTVELGRGWHDSQDNLDESDYANTAENFPSVKDAWRKWVLNEAGDYIGLRTEIDGAFTSDFRTALEAEYTDTIWNEFTPRRRRFYPTLTLDDDQKPIGKHDGIVIEYYNTQFDIGAPENGPEWLPIKNVGCRVLEKECGVYFDGEFPPLEMFSAGNRNDIRIRVTATIFSDKRLEASVTRDADSPQTDVAPLLIDAPEKFRHQEISTLSQYTASGKPSVAAIDNTAIADFAERVRDTWDLMDVGGQIQLEGLDANDNGTVYQVGQRVSGVIGKLLDFEAKNGSGEYPQIVGIDRSVVGQTITLHLQRLKRPIQFGGEQLHRNRLGRRGRRRQ